MFSNGQACEQFEAHSGDLKRRPFSHAAQLFLIRSRKSTELVVMKVLGPRNACVQVMKRRMAQLTDDDIARALAVLKDCDSVELKLTVQESDHRSAIMALGMDVLDAEFRQVVFFDTPDLKLNRSGLIVRARRIRGGGDTVVKLRPRNTEQCFPASSVRRGASMSNLMRCLVRSSVQAR